MIESTFFYMGLGAFSTMIFGLGLTVLEFRKLSRSQKLNTNIE